MGFKSSDEIEIAILEERTDRMQNGNTIINVVANGLDAELESLMYSLIQEINAKANSEAMAELYDHENYIAKYGPHNYHLWIRAPHPCFICGHRLGNYMPNWYCDANGNIVHKKCYREGVTQNDEI